LELEENSFDSSALEITELTQKLLTVLCNTNRTSLAVAQMLHVTQNAQGQGQTVDM